MLARRNTPQKLKILKHMLSVHNHPTAEIVYREIKRDIPNISLATIHRNLQLLTKENKIIKFEINNTTHFDGNSCCHQHLICTKCNKIFDLFDKELSTYAKKRIVHKDFIPDKITIIVKGRCKKCQKEVLK